MSKSITCSALIAAIAAACAPLAALPAGAAQAPVAPQPAAAAQPAAAVQEAIDAPPTAQDWQALAKLPDWSGVWTPVITDQVAQERTNPPAWKPQIAKQIAHMYAGEDAG